MGKPSHKTTLQSIAENYARLQEIEGIRAALFRNNRARDMNKLTGDSFQHENGETPRSEMLKTVKVSH